MKIALYISPPFKEEDLGSMLAFLDLPVLESPPSPGDYDFLLCLNDKGLCLLSLNEKKGEQRRLPTRVDFCDATLLYRKNTSGKQQGLAKAVGLNRHEPMRVLDATAGLGKDAFILASLGCHLVMLERSPIIYSLLQDGMQRAKSQEDDDIQQVLDRMQLLHARAEDYFEEILSGKEQKPDVIYLDPMFPQRDKKAAVKRDISIFQELLPPDNSIDTLLEKARACLVKRVVLKRPGSKPTKNSSRASFIVPGKSAYFEIYT